MKKTLRVVWFLLLPSLIIKIFFAVYSPLFIDEQRGKIHPLNDEYAHFKYVRYLAIHHELPVNKHIRSLEDPVAWIFQDFEYAQPPLYYLLNVPLMAFGSQSLLASRFFSILLSTLTLWFAIQSASLLFKKNELAVVITAISLGFHPILLRVGSAVSNDNLAWFLSGLLFYNLIKDHCEIRRPWFYAIIIGLGILTKTSFLIWPVFLCIRAAWQSIHSAQRIAIHEWKGAFLVSLVALLIGSWFLLYSFRTYGDLTGITGGSGRPWPFLSSYSPAAIDFFADSAVRFLYFPIAEEATSLLVIVQWFVFVMLIAFFLRHQETRAEFLDDAFHRDCLLFTLINLLFFLYANLFRNFAETRHLFIGLIPLSALGVAVLMQLFGRFAYLIAAAMNLLYLVSRW